MRSRLRYGSETGGHMRHAVYVPYDDHGVCVCVCVVGRCLNERTIGNAHVLALSREQRHSPTLRLTSSRYRISTAICASCWQNLHPRVCMASIPAFMTTSTHW